MVRICTSNEMRELDRIAETEYFIDAQLLMENAGRAAVQALFDYYPGAGRSTEILVLAGKGNNAGDAFVVARRLLCLERKVRIFHTANPESYRGPTKKNFEILKQMKAKMLQLESSAELEAFFRSSSGPFTVIDGLIGTGLKSNLSGVYYDIVELINQYFYSDSISEVISLDIPSGVNGDTGAVHGTSILASMTVSFGFPKIGHFLPPGAPRRGRLINVDISLPPRFRKEGNKFLLRPGPMASLLNERDRYGHKNSFGHTLLVGGSLGRLGAICMAASACHKMGTGLVTAATWEDSVESLLAKLPNETMGLTLKLQGEEANRYREMLPLVSSIVIGPGLGRRSDGKILVEELLCNYDGPIVLDADALNLIADYRLHSILLKRSAPTVLTPHPGEMARLLQVSTEEVLEDPVSSLKKAVEITHSVVLLKGATTLVSSTDEVLYLNHYPNDGMATAGTGDVLAGMIGGILGQEMDPFLGTQLAVYLHSLAGSFAAKQRGHRSMTAPDIVDNISNAFKELKTIHEPSFPEEARAELF